MSQGTDIPGLATGRFVQFVADNADHNVATLDGHNTFHDPTWKIDLLWKLVWPLRSSRPGWSGMMQAVHQDTHPGKASITVLPMIYMNPNDMSCVYSTLRFVATECKRHEVTPILTFDQPLWWKGQLIIANEPAGGDLHALILRLGGFHAEMSFLGCIGSVMAASGLEELLGVVFAPNTVKHVLSGNAVARAVRGHMLVDSALSALITEQTFPAAIRSEASCGEPNNTIYQTTESTSAKELRETQPETGNDLRESLVLTDQIVSREVTVATSVRSEQTFPAAIRSEASLWRRVRINDLCSGRGVTSSATAVAEGGDIRRPVSIIRRLRSKEVRHTHNRIWRLRHGTVDQRHDTLTQDTMCRQRSSELQWRDAPKVNEIKFLEQQREQTEVHHHAGRKTWRRWMQNYPRTWVCLHYDVCSIVSVRCPFIDVVNSNVSLWCQRWG